MTPSAHGADDALVEFILDQPGLLDALLDQHQDDGTGYCRACPGPQSGRRRFPCDVRRAVDRAASIRTKRGRADGPPTPPEAPDRTR